MSNTSSIDGLQEDLRGNASGSHRLPVVYPSALSVVAVGTSLGSIAGMFSGMNWVSGLSPSLADRRYGCGLAVLVASWRSGRGIDG